MSGGILLSPRQVAELGLTKRQSERLTRIRREARTVTPIIKQPYQRRRKLNLEMMVRAVKVAMNPEQAGHLPKKDREMVKAAADAVTRGAAMMPLGGRGQRGGFQAGRPAGPPNPINVTQLAQLAARELAPSSGTTPADIEVALRRQGIDWVEPFAPGRPLTPYYGYSRRLRQYDYRPGRNITTDTRPDRLPFSLLKQLNEGYDIATICIRHIISDMRAMKLSFGPMDDYDGDVSKEIVQAKNFLRRPDGNRPLPIWLAQWMMDNLRFDAGCLYRERNAAGKLIALKVIQGTTVAPITDYFGDRPIPPAPFLQQFVQGIPWDWATTDDVVYEPHWPLSESPYGVAPVETVMLNANTDVRLQLYFLQFFTAGTVPEMLLEAPEDMTSSDDVAELQEDWDDFYESNQVGRHGAHWVPHGTKPYPYKPQAFDEKIAQYAMRRTIAAFGLTPQDLGFVETVNRATAEAEADVQYRLSTLPNTEIYEAILNMVIQDDLGLPVAINFDTGREKKDRLMEAQAHQIYVGIGAESPDEVRDEILGLPVDNDNRIPRFYDSPRLGPVSIAWIMATAGQIDPATLSPFGPIPQQPFVPISAQKGPADTEPIEDSEPSGDGESSAKKPPSPAASASGPAAPPPLLPTGTKIPPDTGVRKPRQRERDTHEQVGDMHTDPEGRIDDRGRHGMPTVKLEGAAERNVFRRDDAGEMSGGPPQTTEGSRGPRQPQGSSSTSRAPSKQLGESVSTRGTTRSPRRAANGNALKEATGGVVSATTIAGIDPAADEEEHDPRDTEVYPEAALKDEMESSLFSALRGMTAMPGYGDLWWNAGTSSVWLSLGDGDENEKYHEAERLLREVPGVKNVTVEAEAYPARDGENGWKRIGYIGNWLTEDARKELALWRGIARKKVKDKKKMRRFESKLIPPHLHDYIHQKLEGAQSREDVDKVFESSLSKNPVDAPKDAPDDPKLDPMDIHQINGLALRAADTGRVLMLQRGITKGDPAAGKWEFPGGHRRYYESAEQGAIREWEEETGVHFPKKAQFYGTWDSFNGRYRGWVFEIPTEDDLNGKLDGRDEVNNPDGDYFEAVAWFNPDNMSRNPDIRPELLADAAIVQNALKWPRKRIPVGMSTRRPSETGG